MEFKRAALLSLIVLLLASQLALGQNGSNSSNGTAANATVAASATPGANATESASPSASPEATPTPEPTGAQLLDLEVSYFLEATESSDKLNFTAGGEAYYLVKVGGKNQLLFDSSFKVISDEAEIRRLMAAYVQNLPLPFKKSDFELFKSEFVTVNASWDYCRLVWWEFRTGKRICIEQTTRKLQCWIIFDGDFGSTFSIPSATKENRQNVLNATAKLNASTEEMGELVSRTDAEFDSLNLEPLKARLEELKAATVKIREGYTQFNSGHSQYLTYSPFATDGGLNRCAFNANALTNLEKLTDAAKLFPDAGAAANETIEGTKARLDKGRVRKLAGDVEKKLSDFDKKYKKIRADFQNANDLEATAITGAYVELTSLSLSVKNASTFSDAQARASNFESKLSSVEALITQSEASLAAYADSFKKLNNASETLEAATKVYGQNDARLTEMKKTLTELRSSFELKEADLKHGRPVTAADFQGIADNASNMTATAQNLPRRENEIDFVLIGGLVLLAAMIGGAVWYLRKYKKEQGGL